jgi:hypothetical protein
MALHSNLESIRLNAETLDVLLYIVNHFQLPIVLHSSQDDIGKYTTDSEFDKHTLGEETPGPDAKYVKDVVEPILAAWRHNNTKISGGSEWTEWLVREVGQLKIPIN